jgi:uncharacterized repeat protein (TIGR03803 family)
MRRIPRLRPGRTLAAATAALTAAWLCLAPPASASARAGAEKVLYSFAGANGAGPLNGVIDGPGGKLYGTTVFGGRHGLGCVYALTPSGSGYTEKVLFSFGNADGAKPGGNVAAGAHGDLFGETVIGGAHQNGVAFELVPAGSGSYTEKVLHTFTGGADGGQPIGAPVLDARGDVFGVTQFGGTGGQGVIYELTRSASGYTEHVLHSFASQAGQPQAGLTMTSTGTLFGTLYGASAVNTNGTVFRLQLTRAGPVYADIYNFLGGTDGSNPFAVLTVDGHTGAIYGTTEYGGGSGSLGTVFSLTPAGPGYTERVLHSFTTHRGGFLPQAPLLREANGDLFGVTDIGGTGCSGIGCSTVFELVPAGTAYTFRVLYRFTGPPDGAEAEWAGLIPGPAGTMIGATRSGGTARNCADGGPGGALGCGTIYQITP